MNQDNDFLISSKKVSSCPDCGGSGYVPLNDKKMSLSTKYTVEIGCGVCKGKGKLVKRVDLSLESLKELLNG